MKNFYLLLFVLLTAIGFVPSASAQSDDVVIQFYVHGQPVKSGDRINITEYFEETKNQYAPDLTCVTSDSGEMSVTIDFCKMR